MNTELTAEKLIEKITENRFLDDQIKSGKIDISYEFSPLTNEITAYITPGKNPFFSGVVITDLMPILMKLCGHCGTGLYFTPDRGKATIEVRLSGDIVEE